MKSYIKSSIEKIIIQAIAYLLPPKLLKKREFFRIWENRGYHLTPNSYYSPIPDTRTIKDELWSKTSELIGMNMNEEKQVGLLSLFSEKFKDEYESFPRGQTGVPHQYCVNNPSFGPVDGEILYCMIRYFKPKRIFEIGSGNSTLLSAQAILKNMKENNHECELIAFDPYPSGILRSGFPGLSKLQSTNIQEIPLSEFNKLRENDFLFVDSSHVLKIGSDVQYEYLEILPRLHPGVMIHIHDIFLPSEYPKEWILTYYRFWTEQYLLQAFLSFNDHFEIMWAGSYMHCRHPDLVEKAFHSYDRRTVWPGSFWMRRLK